MKKISIEDVAKASGVSTATVSKVFNGYSDVSKNTRDRVLTIANEMDYIPNIAARKLSSKSQKNIALILNEINVTRGVTRPFELLNGVMNFLDDTDYEFVFYPTTNKKQNQKSLKQFINEHDIAGAIIQGLKTTDPYYDELKTIDFPIVMVDMHVANPNVGNVTINNIQAAFDGTTELLNKGYRKLICLTGNPDAQVSIERTEGFKNANAIFEKNVSHRIFYAGFKESEAYDIVRNLIKEDFQFDGIFAASDMMAIGAMHALEDAGKRIPEDVAIVGFDNIILTKYTKPTLSTIKQDATRQGYLAAQLLDQIINQEVENKELIFEHQVLIRESI
ncbi:LacI family DNA-binding transcriptional regulator [Streptococcus parauberis]|uniref:LacI family DNA-binding transcriptional regulator n=1 Tax=Streptococcus parauberis TaxID=1348 RepID=UPI000E38FED3|nr:LacI family DNA-binding transcriptional regulator [Streptococcus parauberis]RFE01035.1 Catabolite control protein A [Streptococcus parauberis]